MTNCKSLYLHDFHESIGAKFGPFANILMPLRYIKSSFDEHKWVRQKVGVFDESHMGLIKVKGRDASNLLCWISPTDFYGVKSSSCKYSVALNVSGGIIDDFIVYKFSDIEYLIVSNAINYQELHRYLLYWISKKMMDCIASIVENKCIFAVQGPNSKEALIELGLQRAVDILSSRNNFCIDQEIIVSTTGYTGESIGFELITSLDCAKNIANKCLALDYVKFVGIESRDSLRSEVGFPLCGKDIGANTFVDDASLPGVKLGFADNIASCCGKERTFKRVGIFVPGVMRSIHHQAFLTNRYGDTVVGRVTSGVYSPIRDGIVCQGYVDLEFTIPANCKLFIRSMSYDAEIVSLAALKSAVT